MPGLNNLKNLINKISHYGIFIPIASILITYGRNILPRNILDKINDNRINKINQNLRPIIEQVNSCMIHIPEPPKSIENAIWICWMQGEENMPEIAKLCLASIRKNANGHPVILLTEQNLNKYVIIPSIITEKLKCGIIKHAVFSDILRVNLMAQQGGLWLDSTILVSAPIPNYIFHKPLYTIKGKPFGYFVSKCRWGGFVMSTHKGSSFGKKMAKAFELYWTINDVQIDYFLIDHFIDILYNSDSDIKKIIDDLPLNNPNVHNLNKYMCTDYTDVLFNELIKDTFLFKLSNRTYTSEQLNANPNSYYNYLRNVFQ